MEINLKFLVDFKYFGTTAANPECVQEEGKFRLNLVSVCKNITSIFGNFQEL